MKNRIMKVLVAGFAGVCAMFMFGLNGKAYIDPSVTSYIIQAVAGIIIAVAAVIGIYFRKIKKKVNTKLGIDENRNKEVESNEILKKQQDDD
ncbi:hypothetical protein [Aristaeella hokkaidonensis]|uniref:Uncharacterized protein n=1 Tax=Aristaeella hokkaidonensis TaxID=3046382 RepID=A0AC61MY11_9FIRM|nr:hypothetical protein [Aristaeella hokkaidonensis]QUC66673.1 hypothetical protein JYE49_12575 [Aristaeella hokkaidonensis]SNT94646.1 hypothetical protein SAMN06297421_10657 [Aristaeella hokkaidonensis]